MHEVIEESAVLDGAEQAEAAVWAAELAEQQSQDAAMADLGCKRVACKWCDGEFYVLAEIPGPHSCEGCRYKDGY